MKKFTFLLLTLVWAQVVMAAPTVTLTQSAGAASFGGSFTISAVASGSGQLTYQWKFSNNYNNASPGVFYTYFPPPYNNEVLANLTNGIISAFAATNWSGSFNSSVNNPMATTYQGDNHPANSPRVYMFSPGQVAVDPWGDVIIADSKNNVIREVSAYGSGEGKITTIAGNYQLSMAGASDGGASGPATSATLSNPTGVAVDNNHDLFIADTGNFVIREVIGYNGPNPQIYTIAGTFGQQAQQLFQGGYAPPNGPALDTALVSPCNLAVDGFGNVFFADSGLFCVCEIDGAGFTSTVIGTGDDSGNNPSGLPSPANSWSLAEPSAVAVDPRNDNLFVADEGSGGSGGNWVLEVQHYNGANPNVYGIAGGNYQDGYGNNGDPTQPSGPAAQFNLDTPDALAVDWYGNLFIDDTGNNVIEEITNYAAANPQIMTVAGVYNSTLTGMDEGSFGGNGGPATEANLYLAVGGNVGYAGLAVDTADDLYICDNGNNCIRKVASVTEANLTIDHFSTANVGYYQVAVTDNSGTTESAVETVGAYIPSLGPWFFDHPSFQRDPTMSFYVASRPFWTNVMYYTTNLSSKNWIPLATNIIGSSGNWRFSDTNAIGSQRFYRLSESEFPSYVGNSLTTVSNGAPDGVTKSLVVLGEYNHNGPQAGSGQGNLPDGTVKDVKFYGASYNFTLYALSYVSNGLYTNEQMFQVVAKQSYSNTVADASIQDLAVTNFCVNAGDILAFAGTGPYYPQSSNDVASSDAAYSNVSGYVPPAGVGTNFVVGIAGDTNATYQYISDFFGNQGRMYAIGVDVYSP